jgi:predicted RNA-binding Zn-ribbon protein involved in translation (DUF1610 family)
VSPRSSSGAWSLVVLCLLVVSFLVPAMGVSFAAPGAPAPAAPSPPGGHVAGTGGALRAAVRPLTGGSDVVVDHATRYMNGTGGEFSLAGNLTVEDGGHLYVNNLTLSFSSFTVNSSTGPAALLHRFHVTVTSGGSLILFNSSLTTNASLLRTYPKLNVTVENGSELALDQHSSMATAGWIYVTGGSRFYLNDSSLRSNPGTFLGAPGNFTTDNSYAPLVTVTGGSTWVSVGSYLNSTYADPFATYAPLSSDGVAENFVYAPPTPITLSGSTGSIPAPLVPATPLVLDTYPTFSAASILVSYNNSAKSPQPLSASVTVLGSSSTFRSATAAPGLATLAIPLSAQYDMQTVSTWNLTSLLEAFQSGGVSFDLTGSSSALNVTQLGLSLTPAFGFNVTVSDGSSFYAVDTSMDLNWAPTPGNGTGVSPPSSNKLMVTGDSDAYLVNSSALLPYDNVITDVSAFVPDSTSTIYAFQWLTVPVHNAALSPVPGVIAQAFSTLPGTNPNNVTANDYSSASWLSGHLPALYGALASAQPGSAYGTSGANGRVSLSVLTNVISSNDLPGGTGMGSYNLSLSQSAATRTGGTENITQPGGSGTGCAWPMGPTCPRPEVLRNVTMPVLAADLRLTSVELDPSTATAPSTYYEGEYVYVNISVRDMTNLAIPNPPGQVPILISDSFPGGAGLNPLNITTTTYVTNADIASGNFTVQVSWPVPYLSAGSHEVWVQLDPNGTVATPNMLNKTLVVHYQALGVPFEPLPTVLPGMMDGCTGTVMTPSTTNSCNQVVLTGTVVNEGDAVATGATVTFQLNGQTVGSPVVLPALNALGGSAEAKLSTNVTCTCNSVVRAEVQWAYPFPVTNPPASLSFSASSLPIPTVDYTSITFTNVTQLVSGPSGFAPSTGSPVPIGDVLAYNVTLVNSGGPGSLANLTLSLGNYTAQPLVLATEGVGVGGVFPAHSTIQATIAWHVSPNVILSHTGLRTFYLTSGWTNAGRVSSLTLPITATIDPAVLSFTGMRFTPFSTNTGGSGSYTFSGGTLHFNGTGFAVVDVFLSNPLDPAQNFSVGSGLVANGSSLAGTVTFSTSSFGQPIPPGQYSLVVRASFNGGERFYVFPAGVVTLTSAAAPAKPFYEQPLYLILIVVAAVVVVVAALLYLRRSGQGQLVECGECGELIPAKATVCPKCGAEFEPEVVRCSRCASTIPANSYVCPECSALLLGTEGQPTSEDDQRKSYAEFIERYRAEGRKELGENYNEGSFWDWWKRQGTYQSYSAWKLQQTQGTRSGMSAPAAERTSESESAQPPSQGPPPPGVGPTGMAPGGGSPPAPPATPPVGAPLAGPAPSQAATRHCPSCGREINSDFLVCPFCGAVTR